MSQRSQQAGAKSEKRRQQNVVAQRNYRAKQRERVKNLERIVAVALASPGDDQLIAVSSSSSVALARPVGSLPAISDADSASQPGVLQQQEQTPQGRRRTEQQQQAVLSRHDGLPNAVDFLQFFLTCTPQEAETCLAIIDRERFGFRDIAKYGLISLGYALDPALVARARSLPMRQWLELLRSEVASDIDLKLAFAAGLRLLAGFYVPAAPASAQVPCPPISFSTGHLSMSQLTLGMAMRANATQLRIAEGDVADDETESPYFGRLSSDVPGDIKPDLVPTPAQLAIPHHPCFDLVPWPEFRTKAIMAMSTDPPLIDAEDLCLDVLNDGLVCWGSTAGSLHGRGQGASWDGRSWEATPWFLEKWESITGGRQGEMWRNSEWWRFMRGGSDG